MDKLLNALHSTVAYLEGKKTVMGSILFYALAFLVGRDLVANDVVALIMGIAGSLGLTIASIGASQSYKVSQLGAVSRKADATIATDIAEKIDASKESKK